MPLKIVITNELKVDCVKNLKLWRILLLLFINLLNTSYLKNYYLIFDVEKGDIMCSLKIIAYYILQ